MRTVLLVAIAFLVLPSAAFPASPGSTYRKRLDQPQVIQDYSCDKGYAWFYADGRLERCTVARDTAFGEVEVPAQSIIQLLPDGKPSYALMVRNTQVRGIGCAGGGPLGAGEGAATELYPSGKLKACFLAQDQTVQGVPCARGGLLHALVGHDIPVEFYEGGELKSCRLNANYGNWHSGDRFVQGP